MLGIYLDPNAGMSITAQLCNMLRRKIRSGELEEGTRLPSSRMLAREYGIARNIVIDVYEQLIAEGYLIAQTGSGTYVADGIHKDDPYEVTSSSERELGAAEARSVDAIGYDETTQPSTRDIIDFMPGTPDLELFPKQQWAKALKLAAEELPTRSLDYADIRGEPALRAEVAAYLYRTRGMPCHPDQIIIVSGSTEGLALIARAMQRRYRGLYIEEPTIDFAHHIFRSMNYTLAPVPVDHAGMNMQLIDRFRPDHLMLLTPSHHFPTGSILSIQRRQAAVRLAAEAGSYIIEDDYDGDFRLKGVPIPPLYTLNPDRVLYLGTFSKTLAPALRIGFIASPPHLVAPLSDLKEQLNLRTPVFEQLALALFMREGRLDRHIHKMKNVYRHRRQLLVEAIERCFGKLVSVQGDEAGMHLLAAYHDPRYARIDWQQSAAYGVRVHDVREYYLAPPDDGVQILFGYGNVRDADIAEGVRRLRQYADIMVMSGASG